MARQGWRPLNSPILPPTLALIAGISLGQDIPVVAGVVFLGIVVFLLVVCWLRRKTAAKLLAVVTIMAVGGTLTSIRFHPTVPPHHIAAIPDRDWAVLTGAISKPPVRRETGTVMYLATEKIGEGEKLVPATGMVRITVKNSGPDLRYGYRVRLKAKLYRPRNFGNPGAFDYEGYLRRKGVLITGYVGSPDHIEILTRDCGNFVLRWFDHRRQDVERFLDIHALPPGRGLLKALLIGERAEITKDIREAFINAGAVHILAISGLHLGIIVTLIFFSAQCLLRLSERMLLRYNLRKTAALVTFPPLLFYILITGSPISTIRAGIMASVFLLAILLDRHRTPLNTLALAAFLILLVHPASLWDPSFQLSFMSVLGIILLTPPLYRVLSPQKPLDALSLRKGAKIKRAVALSLIASFAAIVFSSPLVALHFHRLSTMGLVSNAIIIPLVGLGIIPLGFLCLICIPLLPSLAALLAKMATMLCCWGIKTMELISWIPLSSTYLPGPTLPEMILFYAVVASLLWLGRSTFKRAVLTVIVLLSLIDVSYWALRGYANDKLRVTFLDVGQGDCALIEFPRGKTMLIDGGGLYGDFDVGERIVAPFLWKRRLLGVDYLVLTHPQPDHYKGFSFIAQHFRVHEFWHNGTQTRSSTYQQLLDVIRDRGIRNVQVADGFSTTVANSQIEILHPPRELMSTGRKKKAWLNNNSVVVKVTHGDHSVLFTGDIQWEAEARLLRERKDVRAHVIKVPHHGSLSSSSYYFVRAVSPRCAIMSLGFKNRFRFPSQQVLRRYEALDCRVLRTDRDGAIALTTDGKELTLATYRNTM